MEASKIKSEKVYLLLRLEVKVTFLKVKLGKLIAQRKAMPNNAQTTAQLHSSHMLAN